MNPIAFSIFGLDIRWYGILISFGIVLGLLAARYNFRVKKLNYDYFIDIVLISLISGVAGARLYYVAFRLQYYSSHINEILNIRLGGLAIHGGLLFGFTAAFIYIRRKKLDFLSYADAASPSIIIAQAVGRWGNFINQEAHGDRVSYEFIKHFPKFIQQGMYIDGAYYNPTFLYESIWNLCIFALLLLLLRRNEKRGLIFFSYIGMYSIGRFVIEGMRTDSLMLGPLKMAQLVSLIGVVVWFIFIFKSFTKPKNI